MHVTVSYISETQIKNSSCVESAGCDDDDEEGNISLSLTLTAYMELKAVILSLSYFFSFLGFRLFSTSVPGQTTEEPPVPVRRRPVYSSRFEFI